MSDKWRVGTIAAIMIACVATSLSAASYAIYISVVESRHPERFWQSRMPPGAIITSCSFDLCHYTIDGQNWCVQRIDGGTNIRVVAGHPK